MEPHLPAEQEDYGYVLYHKEKAPEGREFLMSRDGPPEYWAKSQGYVDNPAKHGINIWGPDYEAHVRRIERLFKEGKIKAIDDVAFVSDQAQEEIDRLTRERDEAIAQLRQQEPISTQMARSKEEYNDAVSDADKERVTHPDAQAQVGVDLNKPPAPEPAMATAAATPPVEL